MTCTYRLKVHRWPCFCLNKLSLKKLCCIQKKKTELMASCNLGYINVGWTWGLVPSIHSKKPLKLHFGKPELMTSCNSTYTNVSYTWGLAASIHFLKNVGVFWKTRCASRRRRRSYAHAVQRRRLLRNLESRSLTRSMKNQVVKINCFTCKWC